MRKSLTIDPHYNDGLCPTEAECNARRWYGAGQLPAPKCWQCPSYELRYLPRPTMPWVGQIVERSTDKQRYYANRWVG
jgi:hypothetical protein